MAIYLFIVFILIIYLPVHPFVGAMDAIALAGVSATKGQIKSTDHIGEWMKLQYENDWNGLFPCLQSDSMSSDLATNTDKDDIIGSINQQLSGKSFWMISMILEQKGRIPLYSQYKIQHAEVNENGIGLMCTRQSPLDMNSRPRSNDSVLMYLYGRLYNEKKKKYMHEFAYTYKVEDGNEQLQYMCLLAPIVYTNDSTGSPFSSRPESSSSIASSSPKRQLDTQYYCISPAFWEKPTSIVTLTSLQTLFFEANNDGIKPKKSWIPITIKADDEIERRTKRQRIVAPSINVYSMIVLPRIEMCAFLFPQPRLLPPPSSANPFKDRSWSLTTFSRSSSTQFPDPSIVIHSLYENVIADADLKLLMTTTPAPILCKADFLRQMTLEMQRKRALEQNQVLSNLFSRIYPYEDKPIKGNASIVLKTEPDIGLKIYSPFFEEVNQNFSNVLVPRQVSVFLTKFPQVQLVIRLLLEYWIQSTHEVKRSSLSTQAKIEIFFKLLWRSDNFRYFKHFYTQRNDDKWIGRWKQYLTLCSKVLLFLNPRPSVICCFNCLYLYISFRLFLSIQTYTIHSNNSEHECKEMLLHLCHTILATGLIGNNPLTFESESLYETGGLIHLSELSDPIRKIICIIVAKQTEKQTIKTSI